MLNEKSRTENSIKNTSSGMIVQILNIIFGLIVRTVFIKCLSAEYLGVNGLFTNVLTMLSLAELGVGSAIIYNMYKPIANKDEHQLAKLMNLYRAAYTVIGIIVAILGVCVIPFMDVLIKDQPNIDNLITIYLLFLGNTVFSYFFAYKRSIFHADQRERVITYIDFAFQVVRYVAQIIILIIFKSFIGYLIIQIVCTMLSNVFISVYADRQYSFLKKYRDEKLTKEEKKPIFANIKALFIYKIGSTALDGTDNIIISAFDGVINVGLLSNYTLIVGSIQTLLNKVTISLTGSVGNFIAKEDSSRHEGMLFNVTFLNFILYGVIFVGAMAVINPFINVWAGSSYVLDWKTVFIYCLNVYIFGMMGSVWTFRSTMGLFMYGKWRPLISAIINLVVSIWWAKYLGLIGVLLGTTFTRLVTNVWYDPYIIYKYGLKKSIKGYYLRWAVYLLVTVADIAIMYAIQRLVRIDGLLSIFVFGVLSVIVFGISVKLFFGKTDEYKYFKDLLYKSLRRIKK